MKNFLFILLFFTGINGQSQNTVNFKEIIDTLPTLKWGKLPYHREGFSWVTDRSPFSNPIDAIAFQKAYNLLLENQSEKCYTFNSKGQKFFCTKLENYKDLENDTKGMYHEAFYKDHSDSLGRSKREVFHPCIFALAKSYVGEYVVVYFRPWYFVGMLEYYALVFDKHYNLISAQSFDSHVINSPHYPQFNPKNNVSTIEVAHATTYFLPNGHIILVYPFMLKGGGTFLTLMLGDDGRFRNTHTWTEEGESEKKPNSKNYLRKVWNDDTNEWDTLTKMIPFKIVDKDGYTNVRESASTKSKIIRKNYNDDFIWGLYENENWLKIESSINYKGDVEYGGYIHTSRLVQISDTSNGFLIQPSFEEWEKDKW